MEPINISQNVSITQCNHGLGHPIQWKPAAGAPLAAEVVFGAVAMTGRVMVAAVAIVIRVSGPVLYFTGAALCLVGGLCKQLAPGLSAVGEEVGDFARLGTGDDDGI